MTDLLHPPRCLVLASPISLRTLPILSLYQCQMERNEQYDWLKDVQLRRSAMVDALCTDLFELFKIEEDYPVLRHCFIETLWDDCSRYRPPHSPKEIIASTGLLIDAIFHRLGEYGAYREHGLLPYHYLWLEMPDTIGFMVKSGTERDEFLLHLDTDPSLPYVERYYSTL